jgi:hypothetical protein
MSNLPKDPIILLSYINTKLRDYYPSLMEFCLVNDIDKSVIEETLHKIDYEYDEEQNRFV